MDVIGYEGYYQVSNLGRVKSLCRLDSIGRRVNEKILKPGVSTDGYFHVALWKNSKQLIGRIHILVAIHFLDHVPDRYNIIVDHRDNNPLNNHIKNLQLITQRENTSKDKKGGSSDYIGVYWNKSSSKWHSQIRVNGKLIHLGYFTNELEASNSYQQQLKIVIKNK